MMSKKRLTLEEYLEKKPAKKASLGYSSDEAGAVTLEVENKGIFNRIAQRLFGKPKISYIHLDENGSFIWLLLDGEKTVSDIGEAVREHFGEKAEPLYERLIKFITILESYGFIEEL